MNRYAIQQTRTDLGEVSNHYWVGAATVWSAALPEADRLLTGAQADRELARLRAAIPHRAATLSIVDVVTRRESAKVWGAAFRAFIAKNGRDNRAEAVNAANRAVVAAGYAA